MNGLKFLPIGSTGSLKWSFRKICPICQDPMSLKMVYGIKLFYCNECYGFTFRLRDVERLSSVKFVASIWKSAATAFRSETIKCPNCREYTHAISDESRNFKEGDTTLRQRLRLNVCRSCHLGWMKLDTWTISSPELDAALVPYSNEFYLRYARALASMEQERQEFYNAFQISDGFQDLKRKDMWRFAFGLAGFVMNEKLEQLKMPPVVTYWLMGAMTLTSLIGFKSLNWVYENLAVRSYDSFVVQSLTSITSFFAHLSFFHLLSNLVALWVFGPAVEDYLGRRRFLTLVFLSSWFGAMFTFIFGANGGDVVLVGASSGVFGLLLFYSLRFWQRRVLVFKYFVPSWMFTFGAMYLQWLSFLGQTQGGRDNVAYSAHLGGAAIGICMALYYRWSPVTTHPAELRGMPGDFERDTKEQFDLLKKIRSVGRKLLK